MTRIHLFRCSYWVNTLQFTMSFKMFLLPLLKMTGFMFHMNKHVSFINLRPIYTLTGQYCVCHKWGLHFDSCYRHQSYSNIFSFMSCHFFDNICNNCGPSKGEAMDWLAHNDVFLCIAIKIFECLHLQPNNLFHQCANMLWSTKSFKNLPLSILHLFV